MTGLSVCVFCGSSPGHDPAHMMLARKLGAELANANHRLVYGGGDLGLMGAVARAAHQDGGDVLGIIPEFLGEAEKTFTEVDHIFVPDMHARKISMFEASDGFIVLPGGIGTLEEAIEVLSWLRMNLHKKPVIFLSDTGYWDGLMTMMRNIIASGFSPDSFADDLLIAKTAKEALSILQDRIDNPISRQPLSLGITDKI